MPSPEETLSKLSRFTAPLGRDTGPFSADAQSESYPAFHGRIVMTDRLLAGLALTTDHGIAVVAAVPSCLIEGFSATGPAFLRHELYSHPAAPVIRLVATVYDRREQPLRIQAFINITDDQERLGYDGLCNQERTALLCYDEFLARRLTRTIVSFNCRATRKVLRLACELLTKISSESIDFGAAEAAVMARALL